MDGLQTIANINTPKSRSDLTVSGYRIDAIAKSPSTKTTEIGWAVMRTNLSNGDIDWAKKNGVPTNEFVFLGTNLSSLDFTE